MATVSWVRSLSGMRSQKVNEGLNNLKGKKGRKEMVGLTHCGRGVGKIHVSYFLTNSLLAPPRLMESPPSSPT